MLSLLAGLLLALSALFSGGASAQANGENISVTLVGDGRPVAGKTWTVALHFVPKSKEWHGYWKNPGDAGLGMTLDWKLPAGWQAGEPLYPVPRRLVIAGLMNHVFEGEYAVMVPISVPASADLARARPLALQADYLACTNQICVPERARLTLDPATATPEPRFDRWRAAIAPLLDVPARYAIEGNRLRLAIPLPAAVDLTDPHFFAEPRDLVNYGAVQTFSRKDDLLVAEIPLAQAVVAPDGFGGILALGDGNGLRLVGERGPVPDLGRPLKTSTAAVPSLWIALVGALLGGLLLNVMPCVFPILSLKAMALARAGGEEPQARRDALAYMAGVVVACLALGAVVLILRAGGTQVGWAFQLQEPGVVAALLVLAVVITANFLGVFELPSLAIAGRGGGGGSFATGLLAAFVATPCTGPFMAAALGAALLLPATEAMLLFAALGLGLALPFLLLGFVPARRRLIPRPGPWMATFQRWMALPMGLTALALVWLAWRLGGPGFATGAIVLAAVIIGLLRLLWSVPRSAPALRRAGLMVLGVTALTLASVAMPRLYAAQSLRAEAGLLDAKPFSRAALAEARAAGKPVFVWFTADWCVTCKVNEQAAIERVSTRDAFRKAGVAALRGDWTRRDEAITRFLTEQGAAGVPLYLWYPAGAGPGRQLPQVLTPGLLAGLATGTEESTRLAAGSD